MVFDQLGVQVIINAAGPVTRFAGGIMEPEVIAAMSEASRACVDMAQLQAAASRVISDVTGAEAGIVTSGASAALLLGSAACLAGLDVALMNRLPEVATGRREFVVIRSQRNMYDRALTVPGGTIVEVGIPDRYSGPGIRDADCWEIDAAIGPKTAGVYYLATPQSRPRLREVVQIAHQRSVPVLVDAAAQLPPREHLRSYLNDGADLVCFSGGKAIGGPQASGILCGRLRLVASALLQTLDLDVDTANWKPPPEFSVLSQLRGLPHHGIGRSCKVGKEEIAGLLVALQRFVVVDPTIQHTDWTSKLQAILDGGAAGLAVAEGEVPILLWRLGSPESASSVALSLLEGTPPIACSLSRCSEGILVFSPIALTLEQATIIGQRLPRYQGA